jgi:hypothetical protein
MNLALELALQLTVYGLNHWLFHCYDIIYVNGFATDFANGYAPAMHLTLI